MLTALTIATLAAMQNKPPYQITPPPARVLIYAFNMKDIDDKWVNLGKYKGQVMLVVNVASQCGLTPQYTALESLYKKYRKKGLVVLGFPSNDFREQEPGTNAEIKQFCDQKYGVTFPLFSKVNVLGERACDLYKWLVEKSGDPKPVAWNFGKFLISREGRVVGRFEPKVTPEDPKLIAAIEAELSKN